MTVPTTVSPIKLVAAGSFDQFCTWCFENGMHPKNPRVRHVGKPEDFRGYHGIELVKTGTWYLKPGMMQAVAEFEAQLPTRLS